MALFGIWLSACVSAPPPQVAGLPSRNWPAPVIAALADVQVVGTAESKAPGHHPAEARSLMAGVSTHLRRTTGASVLAPGDFSSDDAAALALVELLGMSRVQSRAPSRWLDHQAGVGDTLRSLEGFRTAATAVVISAHVTLLGEDKCASQLRLQALDRAGRLITLSHYHGDSDLRDPAVLTRVLSRLLNQ